VHEHSNQLITFHGLDHQPSPRGWAESSPQYMGRLGPAQNGWARSGPVFLKKKFKNSFWNLTIFPCIFYVILINIKQYFYVAKNTTFSIKIPGFRQKKKHVFIFMHMFKSLKAKKIIFYFHTTKKTLKKKCFTMHFGFNNQFIKVTRI